MGGGGSTSADSSVDQVYRRVSERVNSTVLNDIQTAQSSVSSVGVMRQSIRNISIESGGANCVRAPDINIAQHGTMIGQVASSLKLLDRTQMTENIVRTLQESLRPVPIPDGEGRLNWDPNAGGGTNNVYISDTTRNNINMNIQSSIQKYLGQNYEASQTIDSVRIVSPCSGVNITQEPRHGGGELPLPPQPPHTHKTHTFP